MHSTHITIVHNTNGFVTPIPPQHVKCRICQQPPFVEQPAYCGHCLIPMPPIKPSIKCINCEQHLSGTEKSCPNCQVNIIEYPPVSTEPIQIPHHDSNLVQQTIEDLGIDHLSREDQAVALSSIAREKLHLMSGDYHQYHGMVLAQMAYHIAAGLQSQWAAEMTAVVLASAYLKIAEPMTAVDILMKHTPKQTETQIQQLRAIEHRAYLTQAYRMASIHVLADHLVPILLDDLVTIYHAMEPQIMDYMNTEHKSEYLAMDRYDTKLPRLDYLVSILSILIEEAIIRGGKDMPLPDDILDRFLELDNMIFQLGKMSPSDDAAFFAAQFREYIRLFNAVFWYGDMTVHNDPVKRQLMIEQGFERVAQWVNIIPVHFFLILRPARFLEIFIRANSWSNKINTKQMMETMLEKASKLHQPQFLYIFAEAEANAQQFEAAIKYIQDMLSEVYTEYINEDLTQMGQYMLQSIQLEQVGILLGVSRDLKIGDQIKVVLNDEVLQFNVSSTLGVLGLAIFGDLLIANQEVKDGIVQVNQWHFDDPFFASPSSGNYNGHRMDVIVIETKYGPKTLHLLFEGKPQQLTNTQLLPSELLLLRATSFEVEDTELIQLMADVLSGQQNAIIFALQSGYVG